MGANAVAGQDRGIGVQEDSMDLQWQRQVEHWLRLLEIRQVAPALCLSVPYGRNQLYLESQGGRGVLSVARALSGPAIRSAFDRLLPFLRPEVTQGLPLRPWLGRGCLWLSVTATPEGGAEQWFMLVQRMSSLLDRATRGNDVGTE